MLSRIIKTIIVVLLFGGSASAALPFNVVILGDDNAALGGDDCTQERGWTYWMREALQPETCVSYARSGATWTNNALTQKNLTEVSKYVTNNNVIYNQVCRFNEAYKNGDQPEPALIIFAAGTCDAWGQGQRPQIYDVNVEKAFKSSLVELLMKKVNQVTSLAEAVRYNCEVLRESFPDARIVLVTPIETTSAGAKHERMCATIADCASQLGITVIRLDQVCSEIKSSEERLKKVYTTDGSHTNVEGAKMIGQRLAELLK